MRASSLASLVLSLELKERADLAEGRVGPQHGDEGHLFLELLTKTDEKSVYKNAVVDVITKLPEFITDRLDPLAEDGDQGVSLGDGAELGVESVDAGVGVVLKQLLKGGPKIGCSGVVVGDKIEKLGGDPSINPLDDRKIVLHPTRIGRLRDRGWMNMVA